MILSDQMKRGFEMKRKDVVYNFIVNRTAELSIKEVKALQGITTSEVSEKLTLLRNNISKDLNALFKENKLIKVKGKPVLYYDKKTLEEKFELKFDKSIYWRTELVDFIDLSEKRDPFEKLIGNDGTLKSQVQQAKASVVYPPAGLSTIILGETGTGKSLLANVMFEYAKHMKVVDEDAPFITFNCADYHTNPQLLLSQLFGHVKGAFSGANEDKIGLLERADHGMLFLDEIHRLPAEGQEMLFYFLDYGEFNKLGDAGKTIKADVRIICATTENPEVALLKTFIRRLPIVIKLPKFLDRYLEEKIEIIKLFFLKEANTINKVVKLRKEALSALAMYGYNGNIGQLKSSIQLVCAKSFLEQLEYQKDWLEIGFDILPKPIKDFYLSSSDKKLVYKENIKITPNGQPSLLEEDDYEMPNSFYETIEAKVAMLKDEGLEISEINKYIETDIKIEIKKIYKRFIFNNDSYEKLRRIVDEDILQYVLKIKKRVEIVLNKTLNDDIVYIMSLHLSQMLKKRRSSSVKKEEKDNYADGSIYYSLAKEIVQGIEREFDISLPDIEITYMKLLLAQEEKHTIADQEVGILVACHGIHIASGMRDVAVELFGNCNIDSLDMPLDEKPNGIIDKVLAKMEHLDRGKGVLLLVDMGSFVNLEKKLVERTGTSFRIIDMVSTPLILEAIRKAHYLNIGLDDIYKSLKSFRGYNLKKKNSRKKKVIVTVCFSGKGTAIKIKELVENMLEETSNEDVRVVPVSMENAKEEIGQIKRRHDVIAVIGVNDFDVNIPFISLQSMIAGDGERVLKNLLFENGYSVPFEDERIFDHFVEVSLSKVLLYLNPAKVSDYVIRFIGEVEDRVETEFSNSMKICLATHVSCAYERAVIKKCFSHPDISKWKDHKVFKMIKQSLKEMDEELGLVLPDGEIAYIGDIVESFET